MLDDFAKYIDRNRSDGVPWSARVEDLLRGLKWAIASNVGSFSELHIDAAGFCTIVLNRVHR